MDLKEIVIYLLLKFPWGGFEMPHHISESEKFGFLQTNVHNFFSINHMLE